MKHTVIRWVRIEANKGVGFDDAVREALMLSLQEGRKVKLAWNQSIIEIDGESIVGRLCNEPLGKE